MTPAAIDRRYARSLTAAAHAEKAVWELELTHATTGAGERRLALARVRLAHYQRRRMAAWTLWAQRRMCKRPRGW